MRKLIFVGGAALAALTMVVHGQSAQQPTPPAPSGGVRVYVSDETGTGVVIVDPDAGKVVGRIAVGKRPRGIKVSPDGKQLFVALSG
jgi:DNA-binding beta-propeller fold protein YncE